MKPSCIARITRIIGYVKIREIRGEKNEDVDGRHPLYFMEKENRKLHN